jgi:uncharacterized protein (TIGR02246 family)
MSESNAVPNDVVRQAVQRYFAAIAARDPDAWADNFAEDGVSRDPVGSPPNAGRKALRAFQAGIFDAFSEMDLQPQTIFVAGGEAAVPWRCRVRAANGQTAEFEGVNTYVVGADGKIRQQRAYWDMESVKARLAG